MTPRAKAMLNMLDQRRRQAAAAETARREAESELRTLRARAYELYAQMQPSAEKTTLALEMGRTCHTAEDWRWACARAAYKRRANYYDRKAWDRETDGVPATRKTGAT